MGWSSSQQRRLAFEKQCIDQYFPSLKVYSPLSDTFWYGNMSTNGRKTYTLRVEVPSSFPDAPPKVYIVDPCPLYRYDGRRLVDSGAVHDMHVFTPKNGWVQMCLFRSEYWSSDYTIYQCLRKARIWLEAFDEHLRTGRLMCDLVGNQD